MRKLIILIVLMFICYSATAGTITRYKDYSAKGSVDYDDLNGNFNNILNEINSGLDNNNAATSEGFWFVEVLATTPAAGNEGRIVFDKTTDTLYYDDGSSFIATGVLPNTQTWTGDNTFTGTDTFTDLTATTADINAGTWQGTIDGNWTAAGQTCADLGTVSTVNVDGGTLDSVQIGSETDTGMLLVNNSSDVADGLGSQGSSGQFLQSQGTGSNPTFANVPLQLVESASFSNDTAKTVSSLTTGVVYKLVWELGRTAGGATDLYLRFNGDSGAASYLWMQHNTDDGGTEATVADSSDSEVNIHAAFNDGIGEVTFSTNNLDTDIVFFHGKFTCMNGSDFYTGYFGGKFDNSGGLSSVTLGATDGMTGTMTLYKLNTS